MGDDDLVLLALALLWRLVDSLASGAVAVAVMLAGIAVVAGLIAWLGRTLPVARQHDEPDVPQFTRCSGDHLPEPADLDLTGWTVTATRLGPHDDRGDDHG